MKWLQREIRLPAYRRGIHLITRQVEEELPELQEFNVGLAHIFILHTSASLSINENADPDVRHDVEEHINRLVPENAPYYRHTLEGSDDMPAHIKAMLFGTSLTIPIRRGGFFLGTWQGIYLCEHRNTGGSRRLAVTLCGEEG